MIKTDHYGIPTNHIQKLEFELKRQNGALDGLNLGLHHLLLYLDSNKFYNDRSVNINDVIDRLRDAQSLSRDKENKAGQDYIGYTYP